jgi:hypothetical protein
MSQSGAAGDFGKSVMVCQIVTRLALRYPPEHVKFALIDFKRVELSRYAGGRDFHRSSTEHTGLFYGDSTGCCCNLI